MDLYPPNMIRQRVHSEQSSGWKLMIFTAIMVLVALRLWDSEQRNKTLSEELNALKRERNHWQLEQKTFQSQIIAEKNQQLELEKTCQSQIIAGKNQQMELQKECDRSMAELRERNLKIEKKLLQKEVEFEKEKIKTLEKEVRHVKEKSSAESKEAKGKERIKELEEKLSDSKKHIEELEKRLEVLNRELTTCQNEKDSWLTYGKRFATSALGCATGAYFTGGGSLQFGFKGFKVAASIGQASDYVKKLP